jgi:hypothetical protein
MTSIYLAIAVLRELMGDDWLESYILPAAKHKNILTLTETSQELDTREYLVLADLAEVMFNLQPVPGFLVCLERLRNGDIEGTLAELGLGRMLFRHGIPLKYVVPTSRKGEDYDMEVRLPNGMYGCVDAKCKIEGGSLSVPSIENTLKKGRKQLPSDRPGMIFLKHPPDWLEDPHLVEKFSAVASKFFRTTQRIVSVKFYVEPLLTIDGFVSQRLGFKEFSNQRTRFGDGVDWNLFQPNADFSNQKNWQKILLFPDGKPESSGR